MAEFNSVGDSARVVPLMAAIIEATLKKNTRACKLVSMPELPDIAAYISALESRIVGQPLQHIRLASPFLLRTVQPPLISAEGRTVEELRRIGKRVALGMGAQLWLV